MSVGAALSPLLLVADRFTHSARAAQVERLVEAGVRWVQLRDHDAAPERFASEATRLARALRAITPKVRLSINTRLDVAVASKTGLHVGWRGPAVAQARTQLGEDGVLGVSVHTLGEAQRAAESGADYMTFSPVFATTSKPGAPGAGVEALRTVADAVAPVPVYALGGVTPDRAVACRSAGAYGVAVLSGLMDAQDPRTAVAAYQRALLS